jgi:hypothetical protein
MFYCDDCATKNKWPSYYGMPQSRGECEVCGKVRACYDAPVRQLRRSHQQQDSGANG